MRTRKRAEICYEEDLTQEGQTVQLQSRKSAQRILLMGNKDFQWKQLKARHAILGHLK